jgi:hypothetical protein
LRIEELFTSIFAATQTRADLKRTYRNADVPNDGDRFGRTADIRKAFTVT